MDTCLDLIKNIDDKKAQEHWINKLMVKRHLSTYIHCAMVAEIATKIGNALLNDKPEFFVGLKGYTLEEVLENKSNIIEFISNSAYFHDIGKHKIADIINTQTRKISDIEYSIIMDHPNHGKLFAEKMELLEPYKEIILGHHKFYDGTKGYPKQFDNTASDVRIIIDIITICDCVDAATDILGRNYAIKKTFSDVLQEIYDQRGNRYNPKIAEYLMENHDLQKELDTIVTEGRIEICRKIYEEYFEE